MEIINERGKIDLRKWMEKKRTHVVSLDGVVGVFKANAHIAWTYFLTWTKAHTRRNCVNGGGVRSSVDFECRNPTLKECEDEIHTPEMGTWESSRTPKLQSSIAGVKTPRVEAFFISLEIYRSVNVENGLEWIIWTSVSTSYGKKKGWESNWQFDSRPLKVKNQPDPDACRGSAPHRWKALDESYNFTSNLVPIRGLSKEL